VKLLQSYVAVSFIAAKQHFVEPTLSEPYCFERLIGKINTGRSKVFADSSGTFFVVEAVSLNEVLVDLAYSEVPGAVRQHLQFLAQSLSRIGVQKIRCKPMTKVHERLYRMNGFKVFGEFMILEV